jgi:hypothetical protein
MIIDMLGRESLFISLQLSMRQSMKSSVGENKQGRSAEKVKLLLDGRHLKPQVVRPQRDRGDDDLK